MQYRDILFSDFVNQGLFKKENHIYNQEKKIRVKGFARLLPFKCRPQKLNDFIQPDGRDVWLNLSFS